MVHVVLLGAYPDSLINFRGDLIDTLVRSGRRVTAMSAAADRQQIERVEALGAEYLSYPIDRNQLSPVEDLRTLLALRRIFRKIRPDIVLAYTHKPVIYGGLSLTGIRGVRYHALITGLGFAFHGEGWKRKILSKIVEWLFRMALARADGIVFQNPDNHEMFINRRLAKASKSNVVMGSGVNLSRFAVRDVPKSGFVFLMISRLKRDKGVREFIEAAATVKKLHPDAIFRLVGPEDFSLDGVPVDEVRAWQEAGIIEYHQQTEDVRPYLANCGVYVLPSYSEGMPRSVLEAMAMGRPILTTDVPGCRQTVEAGLNGFLVPKAAPQPLAERMLWMIEHRDQWQTMGNASFKLAAERFDVRKVNSDMLRYMGLS